MDSYSPTDAAASDEEEALSSMPNSAKKEAAGLKARHEQEEKVPNPILFEKQKIFNLVLDTSMANSQSRVSAIKETSFESLNNVENLFITADDNSSIANQMSRLSRSAAAEDTDQSKQSGVTFEKDTSFVE